MNKIILISSRPIAISIIQPDLKIIGPKKYVILHSSVFQKKVGT